MEDERKIQELTSALKTLKLQEAELTAQLKKAIENKEKKRDEVLDNTHEASVPTRRVSKRDEQSFHRGDKIWIKNKLHKPATWNNKIEWNEKEGKTATVTDVIVRGPGEQVHFLTDNGVRTWRAPNNVCLITPTAQNKE
jgi:restriction endonuclease S subunit